VGWAGVKVARKERVAGSIMDAPSYNLEYSSTTSLAANQ
jgi:hypothetical protein